MESEMSDYESSLIKEINSKFETIDKIKGDKPQEALNLLILTNSMINGYISGIARFNQKLKGVIKTLEDWIKKSQSLLPVLAKKVNAASYSVSVGVPFGISIAVTWNV